MYFIINENRGSHQDKQGVIPMEQVKLGMEQVPMEQVQLQVKLGMEQVQVQVKLGMDQVQLRVKLLMGQSLY